MTYVTAFFTEDFAPKTGLSPTVDIYRISDKVKIVDGAVMQEIGGGHYAYSFISFSRTEDYVIVADGGSVLDNAERYKYGDSSAANIQEDISLILGDTRDLDTILQMETGRLHIDETLNRELNYAEDGITLVAVFNLLDIHGNPAHTDVFERVPVDFEGAPGLSCGFTVRHPGGSSLGAGFDSGQNRKDLKAGFDINNIALLKAGFAITP